MSLNGEAGPPRWQPLLQLHQHEQPGPDGDHRHSGGDSDGGGAEQGDFVAQIGVTGESISVQ